MRYEGLLLTEAQSRALIDEVDRWCRRTGTNYNKLVVVANVGVTTRHKVRIKGQRVTLKVAARLRSTMQHYRHGISREEYRNKPKPWGCIPRVDPIPPKPEPIRVSSATCHRCGAREGQCEHTRHFERQAFGRIIAA